MANETRVALIGAVATIAVALISGAFSIMALKASQDVKTASPATAVGAVKEGYDTTIKPVLDQTNASIQELEGKLDGLQKQVDTLRVALEASTHANVAARPAATPPPPKRLFVPDDVKFKTEAFKGAVTQ